MDVGRWIFGWLAIVIIKLSTAQDVLLSSYNSNTIQGVYRIIVLLDESFGLACENSRDASQERNVISQALNYTNRISYHGYTLEFDVVNTCDDYTRTNKIINDNIPVDFYDGDATAKTTDGCAVCANDSNTYLPLTIGFLSHTQTYEEVLLELMKRAQLPMMISSDRYIQPSLSQSLVFSVGYRLEATIKAMFLLMVEMNWDYVTVIYSEDKLGHESLKIYDRLSTRYFVCSAEKRPVSFDNQALGDIKTRGVVYLGSDNLGTVFVSLLEGKAIVTSLRDSPKPGQNSKLYNVVRQLGNPFSDALIHYAAALNQTLAELCSQDQSKKCGVGEKNFRTVFTRRLETVVNENRHYILSDNGNLSELPLESKVSFNVFENVNAGSYQIARIAGEELIFSSSEVKAEHTADPSICVDEICKLNCSVLNQQDLLYVHGEYIILVTIQIRDGIDPMDRWGCTKITAAGLFRVETALFTLKTLSRKLGDFRFGLLIMDSCYNYLKTASDIFAILRNQKKGICENGDSSKCLDPDRIVAVVGGDSSGATRQVQTIVREIPLIQITYGATSTLLSNRKEYPYLLRPNPTDNMQTEYMTKLLQGLRDMGNQLNAVSIIYSNSLYGRGCYKELKQRLPAAGICFNLELAIEENDYTPQSLTNIINRLLSAENEGVDIVITCLDLPHITVLMEHLNQNDTLRALWFARNPEFTFVHSDGWNNDEDKLEKYGQLMKGSFTFSFNIDYDSTTLGTHLRKWHHTPLHKTSSESTFNPFKISLTELQGKCKVRGSFLTSYTNLCKNLDTPIQFSTIDDEMIAKCLMKALTIAVYGLRTVAHDNTKDILLNRDVEIVNRTYWRFLKSRIPSSLESTDRSYGIKPFLERSSGSLSYGDGRTGFSLWQIRAKNPSLSKFKYELIKHIDFSPNEQNIDLSNTVFEFYANGRPTTQVSSWLPDCGLNASLQTTTISMRDAEPDGAAPVHSHSYEHNERSTGFYDPLSITLLTLVVCIIIAGVLAIIFFWRKVRALQKQLSDSGVYAHAFSITDETNSGRNGSLLVGRGLIHRSGPIVNSYTAPYTSRSFHVTTDHISEEDEPSDGPPIPSAVKQETTQGDDESENKYIEEDYKAKAAELNEYLG